MHINEVIPFLIWWSINTSIKSTHACRTIINGLCYLATFVFFFNSLGLFLYSGQLAINSNSEGSRSKGGAPLNSSSYSKPRDDVDSSEKTGTGEDQSSDKTQKWRTVRYYYSLSEKNEAGAFRSGIYCMYIYSKKKVLHFLLEITK